MRTATYNVNVASDRRRRENVPRHILCSFAGNFHRKASFKKRLVVDEAFLCQCKSVQDCFGLITQAQLNVIRLSAEVPLTGESLHSGQ